MHHYRHVISQTSSLKGNRTRIRTCVRMPWANAVLFGYRHWKPQNRILRKQSTAREKDRIVMQFFISFMEFFWKKKNSFACCYVSMLFYFSFLTGITVATFLSIILFLKSVVLLPCNHFFLDWTVLEMLQTKFCKIK